MMVLTIIGVISGILVWITELIFSSKTDPNEWKPACVKCNRKDRISFARSKVVSTSVRRERTLTRDIPRDSTGRQTGKVEIEVVRNIQTTQMKEDWVCACGGYSWRWPVIEEEV